MAAMSISVGRDYEAGYSSRYEFCIYQNDKIIARKGNFKSAATARRNGIKAAQELAI